MIDEFLKDLISSTKKEIIHINAYINKLLNVMDYSIPMSSNEIMEKLGLKSKETFRENY